jgi:hypothetical protein
MPIVTRTGKGSKLTIAELDGNFIHLQSSSFQDGTYSQAVEGTGAIIQLAGIRPPSVASGSAGTYVVSPTTSGTGVGASLQLVITGNRLPLNLSLPSSSILDGGTGYASGDEIYVPYTDLGSAGSGSLTLTLADANISIDKSSVITATTASLSLSTAIGDRALEGAIVSLIDAEVSSGVGTNFFSGTTGSYAIEVSSDTGTGGILELVVAVEFNSTYSIDLANSSVIEGGTGYVIGDSFDIPVTSLGGSSDEIVTITLVDGNVGVIDKSTLYLGPKLDARGTLPPSAILSVNAIAISIVDDPLSVVGGTIAMTAAGNSLEMSVNGGLQITTTNTDITGPFSVSEGAVSFNDLPTTDPQSAGQLWVDAANDYVLKVSQG